MDLYNIMSDGINGNRRIIMNTYPKFNYRYFKYSIHDRLRHKIIIKAFILKSIL